MYPLRSSFCIFFLTYNSLATNYYYVNNNLQQGCYKSNIYLKSYDQLNVWGISILSMTTSQSASTILSLWAVLQPWSSDATDLTFQITDNYNIRASWDIGHFDEPFLFNFKNRNSVKIDISKVLWIWRKTM